MNAAGTGSLRLLVFGLLTLYSLYPYPNAKSPQEIIQHPTYDSVEQNKMCCSASCNLITSIFLGVIVHRLVAALDLDTVRTLISTAKKPTSSYHIIM